MTEKPLPIIAKYELSGRLGFSLLGPVFRGRHIHLGMDVVLKVLSPELMKKFPYMPERFLADARSAAKVEHPCIVRVIDCGEDNQLYFVAAQWMEGEPLSQVLQTNGSLEPARAVEIARDIAKGLRAAQQDGMIHRDIRPEHIVIAPGQPAKLQEISVTPLSEEEIEVAVQAGGPRPTMHYRAPEACIDPSKAEFRSDIYSLGVVLFHMLTGQRPFEGSSSFDLMRKVVDQPPLDLKNEKPNTPDALVGIVGRMMAKAVEKRPASYDELVKDLDAFLLGGTPQPLAAEPLPELEDNQPPKRRGVTTKKTGAVSGTRKQAGVGTTTTTTRKRPVVRGGTGRQDQPVQAPAEQKSWAMPVVIIGAVVAIACIGALVTVLLMDSGKHGKTVPVVDNPPDKIDTPVEPVIVPIPAVSDKDKAYFERLSSLEAEYHKKEKVGDAVLEQVMVDFVKANSARPETEKIRGFIEKLHDARINNDYAEATKLSGQPLIDALNKFLADYPTSRHKDEAEMLLADTAKKLRGSEWTTAWNKLDTTLGVTSNDDIDKRRELINEYLKVARTQAGNPYVDKTEKRLAAVEVEGVERLKAASDNADSALTYNRFSQAIETMNQYKLRFHDTGNNLKADEKVLDIFKKAGEYWSAEKKKALEKIKTDVNIKAAKREIDGTLPLLQGLGTMAEDATKYGNDLAVFEQLHKLAACDAVLPNIQNRAVPKMLQIQDKTGLSVVAITEKQIKLMEGGTPVTYMKNWADLALDERLMVYEYLLQPEEGEMPKETQALFDKARVMMKP